MFNLNNTFSPVFLVLALMLLPAPVYAADAANDAEAKEAAEEEAKEKELSETEQIQLLRALTGVLDLLPASDTNPDVVGVLNDGSGKPYLLKLEDKKLLERMKPYNNKKVTLQGKLRNKEKYLIVNAVFDIGGGAAPDRPKRGGI